jgi:nitrite reductase/ring-hydroxylating ferredoxin subunit
MIGGGVAAMGAGTAAPLLEYAGNLRAAPPPDWLVLKKADYELPPRKAKMILYGRIPVLLLQPAEADGAPRALVATCTHLNCTVTYQEAEHRIYCACHDGIYDIEGRVVSGPPPRPLRQLYTKLSDGKLILALERANLEKANLEKANLEKAS